MELIESHVWLENLVLFNRIIQNQGGIIDIKSSYTDCDKSVNT